MSNQSPFDPGGDFRSEAEAFKKQVNKWGPTIKILLIVAAILVALWQAYYTVKAEEVAIVTTFGKFTRQEDPGLHFRIPLVENVMRIKTKRQMKAEFGFRTTHSGINSKYARSEETLKESLMLTGDLNVAIVEWIVHYQIQDPKMFLFKIRNGEETLRDLSEATMREVIGDYSVTEVLTSGREEILQRAKVRLAELCKDYETGISIQRLELKDSAPPGPVKPSFNEVNQAEQERDRKRNEAMAAYNQVVPRAQGEAAQKIEEARGYAVERVNQAKGDVARFVALHKEYQNAREVTRTRLYLETMNDILGGVDKKIIIDEGAQGTVPMLFPLNKEGGLK